MTVSGVTLPVSSAPTNGACPVRKAMSPSEVRATTISASPDQRIRFGEYEIAVHHTPGHCPGGVCLAVNGDPRTQGPSGGPITRDQTSVEYYSVVFVIAESPRRRGELWAGTDDGRVHITRDGGGSWTDICTQASATAPLGSTTSAVGVEVRYSDGVRVVENRVDADAHRDPAARRPNEPRS